MLKTISFWNHLVELLQILLRSYLVRQNIIRLLYWFLSFCLALHFSLCQIAIFCDTFDLTTVAVCSQTFLTWHIRYYKIGCLTCRIGSFLLRFNWRFNVLLLAICNLLTFTGLLLSSNRIRRFSLCCFLNLYTYLWIFL